MSWVIDQMPEEGGDDARNKSSFVCCGIACGDALARVGSSLGRQSVWWLVLRHDRMHVLRSGSELERLRFHDCQRARRPHFRPERQRADPFLQRPVLLRRSGRAQRDGYRLRRPTVGRGAIALHGHHERLRKLSLRERYVVFAGGTASHFRQKMDQEYRPAMIVAMKEARPNVGLASASASTPRRSG